MCADRYPQGMYEFIRDNSWGVSSREMAEMVNEKFGTTWSTGGMKHFRKRHGIVSGLTGRYQKGHIPANKGKSLEEILKNDPEKMEKVRETQFKKGHKPANECEVGTIAVTKDGYTVRKKQMKGSQWERWEFLHRAVWEEHNGPIPEGMSVTFKNGDKTNWDISNLMLVSKAESASLTGYKLRSEVGELTEAGLNLIRLKAAAKSKRKKKRKKRAGNEG